MSASRDDESRLRREIAAGAGLEAVDRLMRIILAKSDTHHPERSAMDPERLAMDANGYRTVVGRITKIPREAGGGSLLVTCDLLATDEPLTPLCPQGSIQPFKAIGFVDGERFEQFMRAFMPEHREPREPLHVLVARVALVTVRYNDAREREGFPPQLRIIKYEPLSMLRSMLRGNVGPRTNEAW